MGLCSCGKIDLKAIMPLTAKYTLPFFCNVTKLAVASLNHAEQVGAIQFLYFISKIKNLTGR